MKKLDQKGIAALEITLIAVLVVLVSATGFYVYKQSRKNDDTSAVQGSVQIPDLSNENKENGKQIAFVEKFYKKYINEPTHSAKSETELVKEYGTKNLLAYYESKIYSGYSPIICAQMVPSHFSVGSLEPEGETVVLSVNMMFGNEKSPTMTVKVIDDNGLKIDSITCGNR